MLDVNEYYADKFHLMFRPSFETVVNTCNKWLQDNNYAPVTIENAKEKLLNHDSVCYPFPYDRIYTFMERLCGTSTENYDKVVKLLFDSIYYVPKDHGFKAGENTEPWSMSKHSRFMDAPNDYGLTVTEINNLVDKEF